MFTRSLAALALGAMLAAGTAIAEDWIDAPAITTHDIHFMSTGVAVGDAGFYASLSTDGTTWTTYAPGTSADLYGFVGSGANFWVSGSGGTFMVNTNGTLASRPIPDGSQTYAVQSKATGWGPAVGSGGSIYFTADYGQHWTLTASGYPALHRCWGGGQVIAVGDGGTILRSTDYGQHWTAIASGTTANLWCVTSFGTSKYLVVGDHGTILRSTDGGLTWTSIDAGTIADLRGVSESKQTGSLVFAAGLGGVILKSIDDGVTWCRLNSGTTADLLTVDAQSNTRIVVAGAGGVVRRTDTGGGSCQTTAVGDEALHQLADLTPVQLRIEGGRVTLAAAASLAEPFDVSVTEAAGRPVAGVSLARIAAGETRVLDLRAAGAPAGVYFVRLANHAASITRRVLVIR